VRCRFGGVHALEDISFSVATGEFVVIVGPSGCGKTTIQNIIAGLLPVKDGFVSLRGSPPRAGRRDIGFMFAQDALLPWRRVVDNVLFGAEIHNGGKISYELQNQALALLDSVGLGDFADAYPRQLSHGMRQRVALARTFLMSSPVLLMDEPFGALDAHTKLILEQRLLQLWEMSRRTVLFITHDLAESIILADRILVCTARPGRIKADVRVDLPRPRNISELQEDERYHSLYRRIWAELSSEMTV
jgi:NitT/TauT family transport system ATP-binding protein